MKTKILASILAGALILSVPATTAITAFAIDAPSATDVTASDINTASTKPQITVTAGNKQATIAWKAVSGATKYAIYSYLSGSYTQHTTTTDTSYTVTGLANGTKYGFLVRALVNNVWSEYTNADLVYATPSLDANKPKNVKIAAGNKRAVITWDEVPGATKYVIYRYLGENKGMQCSTCATNRYIATRLTNGTKYGFFVKAYVDRAWTGWDETDVVYVTPKA